MRTPASVVGDGVNNIQWLIDETNKDPRRGYGHEKVLTQITIDQFTQKMLDDDLGYTLETVPQKGERVMLKPTANLSTGGTSTDVTDEVHPANIFMFERIARIIGLDICGIDVMAIDLRTPVAENGGAILEVNAAPGFRMHIEPAEGIATKCSGAGSGYAVSRKEALAVFLLLVLQVPMVRQQLPGLTAHIAKSAGKESWLHHFRWCVYSKPTDDER